MWVIDDIIMIRFLNVVVIGRPQEFLPEYYLSYVLYLLSNLETYTAYNDVDALQEIQKYVV